jgi:hypothetical protein
MMIIVSPAIRGWLIRGGQNGAAAPASCANAEVDSELLSTAFRTFIGMSSHGAQEVSSVAHEMTSGSRDFYFVAQLQVLPRVGGKIKMNEINKFQRQSPFGASLKRRSN